MIELINQTDTTGKIAYITINYSLIHRSDEGLTLETSAFLPFTVANLRFQPSC